MQSTNRRRVATVLLGASLLGPAAWGAERRSGYDLAPAKAARFAFPLRLWDQLSALWAEEGSFIDPNGARAQNPPPAAAEPHDRQEAGSFIDPDGAA